jgi:hypothetical protein
MGKHVTEVEITHTKVKLDPEDVQAIKDVKFGTKAYDELWERIYEKYGFDGDNLWGIVGDQAWINPETRTIKMT